MKTLYLCGGINGLTDADAKGWRVQSAAALGGVYRVLNPMARDYRGRETENVEAIVHGDLADIDASEVLLVNASKPSWGTAMEVFYAHRAGKHVVLFGIDPTRISPWLSYHSAVRVETLEMAVESLESWARFG